MVCPTLDEHADPAHRASRRRAARFAAWSAREDSTTTAAHDIGAPDVVTYKEMMATDRGGALGRAPPLHSISRAVARALPALGVAWSPAPPKRSVAPLVQSLRHEMVAAERRWTRRTSSASSGRPPPRPSATPSPSPDGTAPARFPRAAPRASGPSLVRSVQRMTLPSRLGLQSAPRRDYLLWLPRVSERPAARRARCRPGRSSDSSSRPSMALDSRVANWSERPSAVGAQPPALLCDWRGCSAGPSGKAALRAPPGARRPHTRSPSSTTTSPGFPGSSTCSTQARFHRWLMDRFAAHLVPRQRHAARRNPRIREGSCPRKRSLEGNT